jgi:hypothetical protein
MSLIQTTRVPQRTNSVSPPGGGGGAPHRFGISVVEAVECHVMTSSRTANPPNLSKGYGA